MISASISLGGAGLMPLVIQAFTGIRSEEICSNDPKKDRLRWNDIKLQEDEPEIHVRQEVAKTNKERYVFLPKPLASWMAIFGQDSEEPIFTNFFQVFYKTNQRLSKKSGVKWKQNGLRKAFLTYHDALAHSLEFTAEEGGNSDGMIRQYYRKPISRAQTTAREWFSLGAWAFKAELRAAGLLKKAA